MFTLPYKGEKYVILNIAAAAADTALDAIAGLMDGGSIELLSNTGNVLAVLRLSDPAAMPAIDGELELNEIAEGDAVAAGQATSARILAADGSEVFTCDCGDENSDAVIKLTPAAIVAGAPVSISSFRLAMP